MPDPASAPVKTFDDRLKTLGLVLAAMTTALGLFVAVKTHFISAKTSEIDTQVKETQARTAAIDEKLHAQDLRLKQLDLQNKTWESSVRLVAQWHVMNANEFARGLDDPSLKLAWVDPTLHEQLRAAAANWKRHNQLMSRAPDQSLLLRQVICLRLLNIGNSPAGKLRLQAHVRDFDSTQGGQGGLYSELQAQVKDKTPQEMKLGHLMEATQEARRLTTEMVIPVAHAVGSQRYVGRIVVPVRVVWQDERQGKEGSLEIEVDDPLLGNRLKGGDLGFSKGG